LDFNILIFIDADIALHKSIYVKIKYLKTNYLTPISIKKKFIVTLTGQALKSHYKTLRQFDVHKPE